MYQFLKSEDLPLTKELVERFVNMRPSPTERELDLKRVRHLRNKADMGLLLPFQWADARLGDDVYRVNGQHSSAMLNELDGALPLNLRVHLDHYEVENKMELAVLFRQFDDRKSTRTSLDISGAYQGLVDVLRGIPRKTGKLGIDAITWYNANVEGLPSQSSDDKYQLFADERYHSFLLWLGGLLHSKTRELHKPQIVAAIYGCFTKNTEEAKTFWTTVASGGVEDGEDSPTRRLDEWLRWTFEERPPDIKPGNLYQACVFCWNAYREGRHVMRIHSDPKKGLHVPME